MNTKELLDRVFFRLKEEDYLRDFKLLKKEKITSIECVRVSDLTFGV